jgi:hypothetical protein
MNKDEKELTNILSERLDRLTEVGRHDLVTEITESHCVDGRPRTVETRLNMAEHYIDELGLKRTKEREVKPPINRNNGASSAVDDRRHALQKQQYEAYRSCGLSEAEALLMTRPEFERDITEAVRRGKSVTEFVESAGF